jgi:hypothetical protein
MRAIIEDLNRVIAGGVELVANVELKPSWLQDWLGQREQIFRELGSAPLDDSEQRAVKSLIDEILGLDATIISRLDSRLTLLGGEIATARRLRKFLANNASPGLPGFLQRSL